MKKIFYFLLFIVISAFVNSCNKKEKSNKKEVSSNENRIGENKEVAMPSNKDNVQELDPNISIPKFNEDSAYYYVKKQVDFGPRVISSDSWLRCSKWLEKSLLRYTSHVQIQESIIKTYDNKTHTFKNIIASFNPEKTNNRIALFAHWDSRHIADSPLADHDTRNKNSPILGANDGGSGVAVLLELSRQFSVNAPTIGVDIILFDAEDYGQPEDSKFEYMQDSWCLGSQYWSKKPHKRNYTARYGILLDMVGAENATFYKEGFSRQFADRILNNIWSQGQKLGYDRYFINKDGPQITDDHYYVNTIAGIPTVNIIEYDPSTKETNNGFNKHWHTHKDNMENINKETLDAVGQTLLNVIYNE